MSVWMRVGRRSTLAVFIAGVVVGSRCWCRRMVNGGGTATAPQAGTGAARWARLQITLPEYRRLWVLLGLLLLLLLRLRFCVVFVRRIG